VITSLSDGAGRTNWQAIQKTTATTRTSGIAAMIKSCSEIRSTFLFEGSGAGMAHRLVRSY